MSRMKVLAAGGDAVAVVAAAAEAAQTGLRMKSLPNKTAAPEPPAPRVEAAARRAAKRAAFRIAT